MDKLTAIRVFLTTLEKGSVSAAAERMGMSRAMASRYIAYLEEWAGSRLLHRTTRKLTLTPAGEAILPYCRQMDATAEALLSELSSADDEPQGMLRISTSAIFADAQLMDLVTDFLCLYPKTKVDLQVVDRTVNLVESRIDLALRITNDLDPGLIARKIGLCRSILCASPEYLLQHGMPKDVTELEKHNCLTYEYFGQSVWSFVYQERPVAIPVKGNFCANEALILQKAAANGLGIVRLPSFSANSLIREGKLVQVLPDYALADMGIYAVYASRKNISSALRGMIDFLISRFESNPYWDR